MKNIDMHLHTTYSDGELTLIELLKRVREKQISELAITDHDTIINMKNYMMLEKIYGVRIVSGIELSVDYPSMHILGYGIRDFELMEDQITQMKRRNILVCIETIELLKKQGIEISFEDYSAIAKKFKLIETAGSDFHRDSDGIPIGVCVEDTFLDDFYNAIYK